MRHLRSRILEKTVGITYLFTSVLVSGARNWSGGCVA
jgi:hypothetical protein